MSKRMMITMIAAVEEAAVSIVDGHGPTRKGRRFQMTMDVPGEIEAGTLLRATFPAADGGSRSSGTNAGTAHGAETVLISKLKERPQIVAGTFPTAFGRDGTSPCWGIAAFAQILAPHFITVCFPVVSRFGSSPLSQQLCVSTSPQSSPEDPVAPLNRVRTLAIRVLHTFRLHPLPSTLFEPPMRYRDRVN